MKIKTKKLSASVARRIAASLVAGSLVFCTGTLAFAAASDHSQSTNPPSQQTTPTSGNEATVDASSYTVNGETVNDGGSRYRFDGGVAREANTSANNNKVTVNGGSFSTFLNGGVAYGLNGNANNNFVVVNGGTFLYWVEGGWATYGNANNNTLTIWNGTFNNSIIDGGYTGTGNTIGNTVNIHGGSFDLTGSGDRKAGIYGGYVAQRGEANDNTVNIYGGTINGDIIGGYTRSGSVRNNTINIYGGDLSNANIYAARIGNSFTSGSGNAINFHTKDIVAKQVGGFDYVGFVLPRDTHHGDTILTLTGGSATNWNGASVKVDSSKTNLNSGDKITLVTNASGLNLDINNVRSASAKQIGTDRNIISYGVARDNYVHYADEGNTLTATVQERVQDLKPQVTLLAEPSVSVRGMIDAGTNRILNWLPPEEIEMRSINQTTDYEFFTGVGGEVMSIDTGNGSKLKNKSGGQNIGAARTLKNRHGLFIFAPITDYGAATYDTTLAQTGTRGGGNSNYFTAGLIARQMGKDGKGMYYEASFRVGKMRTNFTSDNFEVGNERSHVSYRASTPVYTGHVRIGWRGNVSKESELDLYGLYSHNHIGSIDANLQIALNGTEQKYKIDSADSKTVRLGARLTRKVNDHNRFYSGLMYQYQFGGDVRTNFEDCSTPKVGVRGSSGMVELGWQLKPTPNSAVMLDSALVGWVGKQKGLSFQVKLKKDF